MEIRYISDLRNEYNYAVNEGTYLAFSMLILEIN